MFRKSAHITSKEAKIRDEYHKARREYKEALEEHEGAIDFLRVLAEHDDLHFSGKNENLEDEIKWLEDKEPHGLDLEILRELKEDIKVGAELLEELLTKEGFKKVDLFDYNVHYHRVVDGGVETIVSKNKKTGKPGINYYFHPFGKLGDYKLDYLSAAWSVVKTAAVIYTPLFLVGQASDAHTGFYVGLAAFATAIAGFYHSIVKDLPKRYDDKAELIAKPTKKSKLNAIEEFLAKPGKPEILARVEAGEDIDNVGHDVFEPDYVYADSTSLDDDGNMNYDKIPNPKKRHIK